MFFNATTPIPSENTIIQDYRLDFTLLSTPTSVLFISTHLLDGTKRVLKFIKRIQNKEKRIFNEVSITNACNHPNIIHIYEDFEYLQFHVIVMDYTPYRCLYCFIHSHHPNGLPEHTVRIMFRQLVDALNYLHSQGIVHRDIKTGNFLVFDPDQTMPYVCITDFGFSQKFAFGELGSEFIGTLEYAAPEIFAKTKYSSAIDMWSMGVSLYEMLSGEMPWPKTSQKDRNIAIVLGRFDFNKPVWNSVSKEAKDLIRNLICVNPRLRLTADQVLNHPWFNDGIKETRMESEISKALSATDNVFSDFINEECQKMSY